MKKEEILERNRKSSNVDGDERELLISGRANIIAYRNIINNSCYLVFSWFLS